MTSPLYYAELLSAHIYLQTIWTWCIHIYIYIYISIFINYMYLYKLISISQQIQEHNSFSHQNDTKEHLLPLKKSSIFFLITINRCDWNIWHGLLYILNLKQTNRSWLGLGIVFFFFDTGAKSILLKWCRCLNGAWTNTYIQYIYIYCTWNSWSSRKSPICTKALLLL